LPERPQRVECKIDLIADELMSPDFPREQIGGNLATKDPYCKRSAGNEDVRFSPLNRRSAVVALGQLLTPSSHKVVKNPAMQ
jgi:hypothetical protein